MKIERLIPYFSELLKDLDLILQKNNTIGDSQLNFSSFFNQGFIRQQGIIEQIKDQLSDVVNLADEIVLAKKVDAIKNDLKPIISILSQIQITNGAVKSFAYFDPKAVEVADVFPEKVNGKSAKNWTLDTKEQQLFDAHLALTISQLKEDLLRLDFITEGNAFAFTIYSILHKYTARLRSFSEQGQIDVSLFDRNRIAAGVINCLTNSLNGQGSHELPLKPVENKFLFIKGDIAGIQKFIYSNINLAEAGTGKKLAKRLRGRSFYVGLLTDFIASQIIEKLDLAEANLVFSGGGHFNMIAPDNEKVRNVLNSIEQEMNLYLLQKLGGRLSLNLVWISCDEGFYQNSSEYFRQLGEQLELKKNKKYLNYLENAFDHIAAQPPGEPDSSKFKDDEYIGEAIPYTQLLIELIVKSDVKISEDLKENIVCSFIPFRTYYLMPEYDNKDKIFNLLKNNEQIIESAKIIRLNDTDFLSMSKRLNSLAFPIGYGFRFIGSYVPLDKYKDALNFEELSVLNARENTDLSYPQLAVMRLDVDNLGSLFAFGFGNEASFSRVATLSRELHQFFSGYFNLLAKEYQLYITYSGGDDAFVIGSWYNVLHFAKALYLKFKEFVCDNPNITFSAGIFMCDEHYPVAKFAEDAAHNEHLAKSFNNGEKNAICVFDHVMNWESYCAMLEFSDKLLSYTKQDGSKEEGKLARSLVHRLLRIINSAMTKNGRIDVGKMYRNVAQLHYLFARHGFDKERIEQATRGIETDIIKVILINFGKEDIIKNYTLPTNYVILKTRELTNN